MTSISEILVIRNLKQPFIYLIVIGLIFLLPQNMALFLSICFVLLLLTIDKPKLVLVISISIISFRYYFSNTTNIEGSMFFVNFWKHLPLSSLFVQNSHNFVFVYILLTILKQLTKIDKIPREFKNILFICLFILLLIFVSGLLNNVGYFKILLFIMQFFRPLLFFLLIIVIEWTDDDLKEFYKYVLLIIFPMQIVLTFIDYWQLVVQGKILLGDLFTGSFCFPFNYLSVQVMFYAALIIFAEYIISKTNKLLLFIIILVYGILSAQSGLQTAVLIFFEIPLAFWLIFNPESIGLKRLQTNFIIGVVVTFISIFLITVFVSPELKGYDEVVGYNMLMTEKVFGEIGIDETPKIRTFVIFFENVFNGTINPFLGLGPGEYLSGAAVGSDKSYTNQIISNPLYFTSKYTGNMLSYPNNNFVGIAGEIGIIGYILFFAIYLIPYRYILKNRINYFNTFWHSTFIGFIGISFALFGWSFFWNAIEDFAIPVYFWVIGGILYVASYTARINNEENNG